MTELKQIYKCDVCGNMVEVVHSSGGKLECCKQPIRLMVENTVDAAREKHIPVVEKVDGGVFVKVGSVEHPMLDNHYIEWIEVHTENNLYIKFLKPGEKPEAFFMIDEEIISARAYCNLHGLWS